jgi:hypothetical protein
LEESDEFIRTAGNQGQADNVQRIEAGEINLLIVVVVFFTKNRPGIENMVDVAALRENPAYLWLTLTVVSFAAGGLREELWRSSFLAGMRMLWPRQFGSMIGQV